MKSIPSRILPLNITMSLNVSLDVDGNRDYQYNLIGPYGTSSSRLSGLDRDFKPLPLEALNELLKERIEEFTRDQIRYFTCREDELDK